MSITEYQRNQLFNWFEEHMGKDRADTMMSLLPPAGWADVAMKRDLDHLEVAMRTDLDHLEQRVNTRFDALEQRIDARFELVEQRFAGVDQRFENLDQRFDDFEQRLEARIDASAAGLKADLQRTFIQWMFAAQGAVIAAIGLMLAFFR